MERSNFSLRLLPSLHKAAQRVADREECSLNQLINLALAEKVAVLDQEYWRNRREAAKHRGVSNPFKAPGGHEPVLEGDEIPEDVRESVTKAQRTFKSVPVVARPAFRV